MAPRMWPTLRLTLVKRARGGHVLNGVTRKVAEGCFFSLVQNGEHVPVDHVVRTTLYPLFDGQTSMSVELYRSQFSMSRTPTTWDARSAPQS